MHKALFSDNSQTLGTGLLEIKNELLGDDTLANSLALVLGRDPRTHDLPIGVYPRLGNVRLSGSVHNEQQKAAPHPSWLPRCWGGLRLSANWSGAFSRPGLGSRRRYW
jgi:hypothetical protein